MTLRWSQLIHQGFNIKELIMREFDSMNRINIVFKVRQQNVIDVVLYSYQLLKLIFFCKFTFWEAKNLIAELQRRFFKDIEGGPLILDP